MKNEYLNRAVTINPESLSRLIQQVGKEFVVQDDVGLVDSVAFGIAAKALFGRLVVVTFGDAEEAITIRGEEFAAKEIEALRYLNETRLSVKEERSSNWDAHFCLLGTMTYILLAVEDKLFGSDHTKEEKEKEPDEGNS